MATKSDRLTAVLLASGAATQEEIDSGKWSGGQCPYVIKPTHPDGGKDSPLGAKGPENGRQITIEKGDVLLRATGATLEEAIAKLEAKVGG